MPRAAAADRLAAAGRRFASPAVKAVLKRRGGEFLAVVLILSGLVLAVAMLSYDPADPSLSTATSRKVTNLAGPSGAVFSDLLLQLFGFAAWLPVVASIAWAWRLATHQGLSPFVLRLAALLATLPLLSATLTMAPL
ncbi:MAG TPA: DNA translocase FtsK 4TM domain-containing protein, partial [Acetobacteraceae bacterium]|nr:DNA translocase FtsK 4TM domain-containing protein [Acetobacteraceae bacterium]